MAHHACARTKREQYCTLYRYRYLIHGEIVEWHYVSTNVWIETRAAPHIVSEESAQ
jgi:hypothetical protein